ncbi:uncharacterized protein LOC143289014 [Babylonia areolata]|uniref:uncharacterized protein LOC143289014 n=1 Tax=Babylonia areolata TaxID=304850 RepID=UPI003FD485E5
MATSGDIKYNVTCGVLEEEKKSITLMYTVPDPKDHITWDWIHKLSEDGTSCHVAQMIAQDSKRGHRSRPIPDPVFKKLGSSPKKTRDGIYYKVKMSRKDEVSIEEYFNAS